MVSALVFTVAVRRDKPGWTRRAVLGAASGAAVAGAVSGCSWFESDPPPPPPPDPLEPFLAATRALATRYQRVLASHPDLVGQLRPLQQAHLAHAAALVALIGRPELASPTATTTPEPTGPEPAAPASPDPAGTADPAEPTEPAEAVAGLRAAEQDARAAAAEACLAAPPERAALLGSITAARATHAEVLDAAG